MKLNTSKAWYKLDNFFALYSQTQIYNLLQSCPFYVTIRKPIFPVWSANLVDPLLIQFISEIRMCKAEKLEKLFFRFTNVQNPGRKLNHMAQFECNRDSISNLTNKLKWIRKIFLICWHNWQEFSCASLLTPFRGQGDALPWNKTISCTKLPPKTEPGSYDQPLIKYLQ